MNTQKHPCYSEDARHQYARMHIPVAPACNVACNYCNRKFDCLHESRPGVTSEILSPDMALDKFCEVKKKIPNVSVVGIAGPGDALANWQYTKRSIELIQQASPETIFCLSTNGLMLPKFAQEIIDLGVRHVTVTCNAIDPQIGANLYKHVVWEGKVLTGVEAAEILLENQLKGIELLVRHGVMVKVNIVMVKGINDQHIPEVVKKVKALGVFMTNIMPLIPAPGSAFEYRPQTSMKEINEMRDICQLDIKQMRHCKQCRADAIGLLDHDCSQEFRGCQGQGAPAPYSHKKLKIAVASKYGKLVDLHFGHAKEFSIYQIQGEACILLEIRGTPPYCLGMPECDAEETRRDAILEVLQDCDAVLTMRIGHQAKERLRKKGINSFESCDTVENGLRYAAAALLTDQAG